MHPKRSAITWERVAWALTSVYVLGVLITRWTGIWPRTTWGWGSFFVSSLLLLVRVVLRWVQYRRGRKAHRP